MKNLVVFFALFALTFACFGYDEVPTFSPNDPFYGDYMGPIKIDGRTIDGRALVVAEKHEGREFEYRVLLIEKNSPERRITNLKGKPSGDRVPLSGDGSWRGVIENGKMTISRENGSASFEGKFTVRTSPTMGMPAPEGATILLPYKKGEPSSLEQWQNKGWKLIDDGSLQVGERDNPSVQIFGAIKMHVEFCNPYKCYDFGQGRGNSGVYLQGRCEVQVLDSFGEGLNEGNCGGVYNNAKASVEHVSMPPAHWQTYEIEYYPALFDIDGNKIVDPQISVVHNGVQIHKDVNITKAPTPAAMFNELAPMGPLVLQNHSNPVRFRNLWLVNIEDCRSIPGGANISKDKYLQKLDKVLGEFSSYKDNGDVLKKTREYLQNGYNLDMLGVKGEIEKRLIAFAESGASFESKMVAFDELDVLVSTKAKKVLDAGNKFPGGAYLGELDGILGRISNYDYRDRGGVVALKQFVDRVWNNPSLSVMRGSIEDKLINFVKGGASDGGKLEVCRLLNVIGGETTVKGLGPVVAKDGMTDLVLFAIERNNSASVDAALLGGLAKSKGVSRIAIINALGRRKCSVAVDELGDIVRGRDKAAAVAAARGLGNIGSTEAAEILEKACRKTKDDVLQAVVYESLLDCGDSIGGQRGYDICENVYANTSGSLKEGGLVGMVRNDPAKAGGVVLSALRKGDESLQSVAASLLDKISGTREVERVAGTMGRLSPSVQLQVIASVSRRGDDASRKIVLAGINSDSEEVRLAAITGLGSLGSTSEVGLLAGIAANKGGKEHEAAVESLAVLGGNAVDAAIVAGIAGADSKVKVELVRAIGSRGITSAVDEVIGAAKDSDGSVRNECYKVLPLIAEIKDMDGIVGLVVGSKDSNDWVNGERALIEVGMKTDDVELRGKAIWKVMPSVEDTAVRGVLLRVLGKLGDRKAMPLFVEALKSDAVDMRIMAANALAKWHNGDPAGAMIEAAENDSDLRVSVLALKGYVNLVKLSGRNNQETVAMLSRGLRAAKRPDEKKVILELLPDYFCQEGLDLAKGYLGDDAVKDQAGSAARKITGALQKGSYSVSASRAEHNAKKAIDNDPSSRWDSEGSMKPGQWFALHLGRESEVQGIVLDTSGSRDDYPRGCEVYVSTDGSNWGEPVAKVAEGKSVMEIEFGKTVKASHIKIVQMGEAGNFWSIHELSVIY